MSFSHTLLVANRGEIAARIFRTARELGIRSIAVYTQHETDAGWVKLADEAFRLEGTTAAETYLNQTQLLEVAKTAGATAIHPGYGFLSENAEFAGAVQAAGLTWIGPAPEVINALGNKATARQLAISQNVQVIPGTQTPLRNFQELIDFGNQVGFPIISKDPAGGGGKGIIEYASSEAATQFFNERGLPTDTDLPADSLLATSFLEKRLVHARHIETQCLRDSHGNFWLASTRDCSVQRRNQKLIEEAPASGLNPETLTNLQQWSKTLFEAVNYVGAGTCEFLVDEAGNAYFLEVNPRLQVEHTVTEEITGVDLVALQLAVATQGSIKDLVSSANQPRGHSIQLRITSEDPAQNLLPQAGKLHSITWPSGAGIRIDAALVASEEIPVAFDSLIAKLIVTAPTRALAIAKAKRALAETKISGVPTSIPLYEQILSEENFACETGKIHTRWLEENLLTPENLAKFAAETTPANSPTTQTSNGGTASTPKLSLANALEIPIEIDGKRSVLRLPSGLLQHLFQAENNLGINPAVPALNGLNNGTSAGVVPTQIRHNRRGSKDTLAGGSAAITAPMQATVTRVNVTVGQTVSAGDLVCVIEAMKMEQPLYAAIAGVVKEIKVNPSEAVTSGQILLIIDENERDEK
ncbi:bacteriochlorophyll 4-vinyl reductase [Gleimia sp. 6138-11-ORH1]|uniref:acetyl/propionyl/methylcrotonyl-CoA carboxylase subunit alpha n=1 Tax=Gleimia sp. 6138-11-ORH1 TaxID=2973937 RepID=UPI0021680D79|nr:biotin carboxylase N-terminal domain-containing protein [Gleimia sp. 6138-11-ORH1]MCS4484608.1 bacteriochlorophyll 4-vinyl reductase [Gleimia sp. 6138-11-ORH1]